MFVYLNLCITGMSFTETVLLATQNLVGIKVLHHLAMDNNVFHCLAAYGGEGNRPVVCPVTLVSLLRPEFFY